MVMARHTGEPLHDLHTRDVGHRFVDERRPRFISRLFGTRREGETTVVAAGLGVCRRWPEVGIASMMARVLLGAHTSLGSWPKSGQREADSRP